MMVKKTMIHLKKKILYYFFPVSKIQLTYTIGYNILCFTKLERGISLSNLHEMSFKMTDSDQITYYILSV